MRIQNETRISIWNDVGPLRNEQDMNKKTHCYQNLEFCWDAITKRGFILCLAYFYASVTKKSTMFMRRMKSTMFMRVKKSTMFMRRKKSTMFMRGKKSTMFMRGKKSTMFMRGMKSTMFMTGKKSTMFMTGKKRTMFMRDKKSTCTCLWGIRKARAHVYEG